MKSIDVGGLTSLAGIVTANYSLPTCLRYVFSYSYHGVASGVRDHSVTFERAMSGEPTLHVSWAVYGSDEGNLWYWISNVQGAELEDEMRRVYGLFGHASAKGNAEWYHFYSNKEPT